MRYALPDAWSIGIGSTISADWKAGSDNRWTVPVGLVTGKDEEAMAGELIPQNS